MTTGSLRVVLLASSVVLAAAIAYAGVKVQVDHDPEFDFSTLHTWTWHPKGPGNAVRIITQEDDSAEFRKRVEPRLLPMVESEFARRGFTNPSSGEPDFYVTYYVLVTVGDSHQHMGQFANTAKWGLPPMTPSTTSLKIFPYGSLILDVTSRATSEIVWRGVAQAELKWEESDQKRDERVRNAVKELLKKFPPKSAKKR